MLDDTTETGRTQSQGCNHQSIWMPQLQPLCSASGTQCTIPRNDECSGKPESRCSINLGRSSNREKNREKNHSEDEARITCKSLSRNSPRHLGVKMGEGFVMTSANEFEMRWNLLRFVCEMLEYIAYNEHMSWILSEACQLVKQDSLNNIIFECRNSIGIKQLDVYFYIGIFVGCDWWLFIVCLPGNCVDRLSPKY